ncbi:hypothetical protein [Myroides guanonis]|nr:hypothetical protein [Myroides guanonis]
MKKILLLLLTITFGVSCSNDDDTEGREVTKLKSEKIIADYINEYGEQVKYESIYEYSYGANGFVEVIKNTRTNPNSTTETNEYLYYEGNKVVRRKYKQMSTSKNEIEETYTYENDLIVEATYKLPDYISKNKYYYDSSKNLIKDEYYYSNNDMEFILDFVIEYQYKDGNVSKQQFSSNPFDKIITSTYEYDDKNISKSNIFPVAFQKITYTSKNNIVKVKNEESGEIVEYNYEYNSKGFPIKATYDNGHMTALFEYY